MNTFEMIPAENKDAWKNALALSGDYDIYHLPEYHLLSQQMGEGTPYLLSFHYRGNYAALPLLLRPLAAVEGLEGSSHFDATSVYGYPGIVTSVKEGHPGAEEFRTRFQSSLIDALTRSSAVTFFSRTNPLLPTSWLFEGVAEVLTMAPTIAIDLTKPEAEQIQSMSESHRRYVRKARNQGIVIGEDVSFQHIDDFIPIYNETMKRVGATGYYFFQREYYYSLKNLFGNSVRLFFARSDRNIVSAFIFFTHGKIIQYHLSGTPSEFFQYNGAKAMIDFVRRWGTDNGFSWLHLGGGVGSSVDSLYNFKAGFSKLRFDFKVVRIVVAPVTYLEVNDKRKKWIEKNGYILPQSNYFPEYRQQHTTLV